MKPTFAVAMGTYAFLALIAGLMISEPKFRLAVWILLGGLAVKTVIARGARW
jgi:hypothetical protein